MQTYYRVDPSEEDHANKVFDGAAKKICKDLFSNLRLQVTNAWLRSQGQPLGRFRDASDMYLTAEQYGSVMILFDNCGVHSHIIGRYYDILTRVHADLSSPVSRSARPLQGTV